MVGLNIPAAMIGAGLGQNLKCNYIGTVVGYIVMKDVKPLYYSIHVQVTHIHVLLLWLWIVPWMPVLNLRTLGLVPELLNLINLNIRGTVTGFPDLDLPRLQAQHPFMACLPLQYKTSKMRTLISLFHFAKHGTTTPPPTPLSKGYGNSPKTSTLSPQAS